MPIVRDQHGPYAAVQDQTISDFAHRVYTMVCTISVPPDPDEPQVWRGMTEQEVAEALGRSLRSVRAALKSLRDAGYLP